MSKIYELNNFQAKPEINSIVSEHTYNEKSPVIEIFSAMIKGEDTSKYGEKANKAYNYIKTLAANALAGDGKAKVELNTITSVMIQAPLLKRLQLLSFMGNVTNVAYNERLLYKVYKLQGKMSNFQASQGDVTFATETWDYREMSTQTISGGTAVNYRELATGNFDNQGVLTEQVITDMMNKVFYKIMVDLYSGVKNATGIKHFVEASGITSQSVKDMVKVIRRWGNVGLSGDFSVVSQLNDFVGFKASSGVGTNLQLPTTVVEEIMKTGLLNTFFGSSVVEIPNTYNLTKLNSAGDNYETYLPEGLLFAMVNGEKSPLQVGYRGGLTSKAGFDVVTGNEITRFDMEVGSVVIPEYVPTMGIISDSNFAVDKT